MFAAELVLQEQANSDHHWNALQVDAHTVTRERITSVQATESASQATATLQVESVSNFLVMHHALLAINATRICTVTILELQSA